MGLVFGARPMDAPAFLEMDRELDVERDFDARPDDLAIALNGMAVSDKQQSSFDGDREVDGDALLEAFEVHVAAMRPGGRGGDGLSASRRDAEAAQHRA